MKGKRAKAGSMTRDHAHVEGICISVQELEAKLNCSIKG